MKQSIRKKRNEDEEQMREQHKERLEDLQEQFLDFKISKEDFYAAMKEEGEPVK